MTALVLVGFVAIVGLGLLFTSGNDNTANMSWNEAFAGYGECPSSCYDKRVKAVCLIWPGTGPQAATCYGKTQRGYAAKCSCPVLE